MQKQMLRDVIDSYFSTADLQVKVDTLLRLDPLDGLIRGESENTTCLSSQFTYRKETNM